MPPATSIGADWLLEPWFSSLRERLAGLRIFDCYTHLGCADPDGPCFAAEEHQAALDVVDARAVVFPLAEPRSYQEGNDRALAAAQSSDGRLTAFCRVDPRNGGLAEVKRAVERGLARRRPSTKRRHLRSLPDPPTHRTDAPCATSAS